MKHLSFSHTLYSAMTRIVEWCHTNLMIGWFDLMEEFLSLLDIWWFISRSNYILLSLEMLGGKELKLLLPMSISISFRKVKFSAITMSETTMKNITGMWDTNTGVVKCKDEDPMSGVLLNTWVNCYQRCYHDVMKNCASDTTKPLIVRTDSLSCMPTNICTKNYGNHECTVNWDITKSSHG